MLKLRVIESKSVKSVKPNGNYKLLDVGKSDLMKSTVVDES